MNQSNPQTRPQTAHPTLKSNKPDSNNNSLKDQAPTGGPKLKNMAKQPVAQEETKESVQ